ncbi:MAG: S9 family peptidase, partial [Myxococcales bacterium]|nr:S9 family peptidase [Myxococcales bacterium]
SRFFRVSHPLFLLAAMLLLLAGPGCGGTQTTGSNATSAPTSTPPDLEEQEIDETDEGTPGGAEIEQFMQILAASTPHVTADGTTYYTTFATGVTQLYRYVPDGDDVMLTAFDDGLDFFSVSNSGDLIIVGASVGGSEQADLFLVRGDGTGAAEADLLIGDPEIRYENVYWAPDDAGFYFRSNQTNGTDFHLFYYDLSARSASLVAETAGYNWIEDVSDDGQHMLVVQYLSNADSNVFEIDLSGDRPAPPVLLTEHEGEVLFTATAYDAEGRIWLLSNRDSDRLRLGILSRDDGSIDYRSVDNWEIESAMMSADRSHVAYTTNEDGYSTLHILDTRTDEVVRPNAELAGGIVEIGAFQANRLALTYSSPTKTSDIWLLDYPSLSAEQITFSDYAGIDQSLFTEPQLVRYTSFDGLEIPAFLYLPPGYEGGPVPTIIHVHGGPESQFRPYFIRHFQYLQLNGFAILAPNVRGSSGYGPEYLALDNYTLRLDSVRDIEAGVEWLLDNGYTTESMLGIKGGSYGGYMVMAAITEMPTRFAAAVEEVGIVNFVTFLENTADYRRALREAEYGPLSDREFLESISPIHKVDEIVTPLLVIHGENDPRVPVSEARQIIAALEERGQEVDSLIFPDEGHGVAHLENRLVMYRAMVDFFARYLQPEAAE